MSNALTANWLTPPQVAKQFNVSLPTVRGWISTGALKAINAAVTGRQPRYRIHVDDIRAFKDGRIVRPADEAARPADEALNRLLNHLDKMLVAYEQILQKPADDILSRLPPEQVVSLADGELLQRDMKNDRMQVTGNFLFLRDDARRARQHGEPFRTRTLTRIKYSADYLRGLIRNLG